MDEPNPLLVQPPQNQQQQPPPDETQAVNPNKKRKDTKKMYKFMRKKGYYQQELSMIANRPWRCSDFVSASEDKCPLYLRLAPANYPQESFVKAEHIPKLRDFLMKRTGRKIPRILDVVSVDGYALMLCNDKSTLNAVRRLWSQMAAEMGMQLRQPSKKEIAEFCRVRRERVAIEGRDTGLKKYLARKEEKRKQLAKAAASTEPDNVPQCGPSEPAAPSGPNILPG